MFYTAGIHRQTTLAGTDRKPHLLVDKGSRGGWRKVGKGGGLLSLNVTCCSVCSHYKISLTDKEGP